MIKVKIIFLKTNVMIQEILMLYILVIPRNYCEDIS